KVAGTSENWGDEQERLNNVFGAHLRITGLKGDDGFGVELLEYLSPRTGRPYPPDSAADDAWHWQIRLTSPNAATLSDALRKQRTPWVSNGVVDLAKAELGYHRA